MKLSFTPSPTRGETKPTYRGGILKEGHTRTHTTCSGVYKSRIQSIKYEHLPKIINGQKPAVPVFSGNKSGGHLSHHPTPRRSVLASAGETMQVIWAMRQPVQKIHAWCMSPGTLWNSANYLRNTLRSAILGIHTKTRKPAPEAKKSSLMPSSLTARRKRSILWNLMMNPSQKRIMEKSIRKNPRMIRPI